MACYYTELDEDLGIAEMVFQKEKENKHEYLEKLSDTALLDLTVAQGDRINHVTDRFKCYDAAVKIKRNGWKPTERQREAIENILAHWLAGGV
jgi:hypothetical protein